MSIEALAKAFAEELIHHGKLPTKVAKSTELRTDLARAMIECATANRKSSAVQYMEAFLAHYKLATPPTDLEAADDSDKPWAPFLVDCRWAAGRMGETHSIMYTYREYLNDQAPDGIDNATHDRLNQLSARRDRSVI